VKVGIFEHDSLATTSVYAHDSSEWACLLVLLYLFTFKLNLAAFFEQALTGAVWTRDDFITTVVLDVGVHVATLDGLATVILTRQLCVLADGPDVVVHVCKLDRDTAAQQAAYDPVLAHFFGVAFQVSANNASTQLGIIGAFHLSEHAVSDVFAHVTLFDNYLTQVVRALNREFTHQPADRDIRCQGTIYLLAAERAGHLLADARLTE